MIRRPARLLAVWTFVLGLSVPSCGAGPQALTLDLRARAFEPGEPLRVELGSPQPLDSATGDFLGHPIFFSRVERGADGEQLWVGWSMIALDQPPGLAAVEVRGRTAAGALLYGTRAVTVGPKSFPEERLEVAPDYVEPPPELAERLRRERKLLTGIYATRRDVTAATPFVRPVPGEPTSAFGTRRLFNGQPRSPHPGLDLRAASGTRVRCSGPGRVVLARELYYAGKTVIVDHGGGLFTLYAHLSELRVAESQRLDAGEIVGVSGATGRVTGPHLHWGAKVGDRPFDPTALLDPALFPDDLDGP